MTLLRQASYPTIAMLVALPILAVAGIAIAGAGDRTAAQLALYIAVCVIAYLIGSISWGYIFVNLTMGEDIRDFGSGRTGMSNILRTSGGKAAAAVFLLDAGKGVVCVLLARTAIGPGEAEVAAALLALCGHNWPIFLRFRGGRGIMPGLGALSVMAPWVALAGAGLFLVVTLSSRILSLGSIVGTLAVAVLSLALMLLFGHSQLYTLYACVGGAVIIWQHRDNIRRIAKGTERRLGMPAVRNR
ncbi:Glycerol-3-phosphate acyltransferase [Geodia barretti]|uniref:Glycerol-3-phosphate acyltransferase n=1 Tax=Geodia barretti TaxID=519541 RepID=A0AA35XG47_GEOBA|nr:Glycerol-3-phosphate acyltransferase [Geodia barretti]